MKSIVKQGLEPVKISEVGVVDGLVAWYPLAKDTLDYVGNLHLTNYGAMPSTDSFIFDGTSYMDSGSSTIANSLFCEPNVSWSVTTQFKLSGGTDYQSLVGRGGGFGSGTTFALFSFDGNSVRVRLRGGDIKVVTVVGGEWHTVAVTWNGVNARLFVNGDDKGAVNVGTAVLQTLDTVQLGKISIIQQGLLNGELRDVRFYEKSLSAPEVMTLHNLSRKDGSEMIMTGDVMYVRNQIKEVLS